MSSSNSNSWLSSALGSAVGVAVAYTVSSAYSTANSDLQEYGEEYTTEMPEDALPNTNDTTALTDFDSTDNTSTAGDEGASPASSLATNIAYGVGIAGLAYATRRYFLRRQKATKYNKANKICYMCGTVDITGRLVGRRCKLCKHVKIDVAEFDPTGQTRRRTNTSTPDESKEPDVLPPVLTTQWQVRRATTGTNAVVFVERRPPPSHHMLVPAHKVDMHHLFGTYPTYVEPTYAEKFGITALQRHQTLSKLPFTTSKIKWFQTLVRRRKFYLMRSPTFLSNRSWKLVVDRGSVLESSFDKIRTRTVDASDQQTPQPIELWRRFQIEFQLNGERQNGTDAGGLLREWFVCVGQELFSCQHGLFKATVVNGEHRLFIREDSATCNGMHLDYFQFAGRLIGMALVHRCTMPVPLCDYIWKLMADEPINCQDVSNLDNELCRFLQQITSIDNVDDCDLEFKYTSQSLGRNIEIDLTSSGADGSGVTNENRAQFVEKWTRMALIGRCEQQLLALLHGVFDVLPANVLSVLSSTQLKEMVNGCSKEIDVADWQEWTRYKPLGSKNEQVNVWFWEIVADMSKEDKSKLLQFCTGSSALPAGGFQMLSSNTGGQSCFRVSIADIGTPVEDDDNKLCLAHTCFNEIVLHNYTTKKALERALYICKDNAQGFGVE